MARFKITRKELKKRTGYLLLSFFTFYLVTPLRELINQYNGDHLIIGIAGLLFVLYFWKF